MARDLKKLAKRLDAGDLDDIVHDCMSRDASIINNEGVEAQLEYLQQHFGSTFDSFIEPFLKEDSDD